jgi:hypothetical protein
MSYGFLNCFGGYALKVEAARGEPRSTKSNGVFPFSARTEPHPIQGKPLTVWTEDCPSRF